MLDSFDYKLAQAHAASWVAKAVRNGVLPKLPQANIGHVWNRERIR